MRIGIDMLPLQSPDSSRRGVGRYVRGLLRALDAVANGMELILYAHDGLPTDEFPKLKNDREVTLRPDPAEGERSLADALQRIARDNPDGLDALLIPNPFELTPHYAPPARALDGPPLLAVVHDLIPFRQPDRYLDAPGHARRMYHNLERLRQYDRLLTNSEATRLDCLDMLGLDPRRVVHIGAAGDPGYYRPDRSFPIRSLHLRAMGEVGIRGNFIFGVSGMDDRKNWRGLIDAYALLPIPLQFRYQLVIACSLTPEYEARVREYAYRLGLIDHVVLTGPVDDATLRVLYQRCSAFAFPSTAEGFGLPLVEAMQCGAPVIAGNNTSQPEVVGDAGLLINAEDPADLAAALRRVLEDPEFSDDLRRRAIARAAGVTWDVVAERAWPSIVETVEATRASQAPAARRRRARPRIAMFSPWPPKASGISDYSARLVRELAGEYAVDLYHEPGYVPEVALGSGDFACHDARLFERNRRALGYRGVVYQMGNSYYHKFIWEAMQRRRGVVVQHDFLMAGFHYWYAHTLPDPRRHLVDELEFHAPHQGLGDQIDAWSREPGGFQEAAARRGVYMNRRVFECAEAMIVHSPWCLERAAELDPRYRDRTVVVPHGADTADVPPWVVEETRDRHGIPRDALVVASFGILTNGKMNVEALAAFRAVAAVDPKALFLFVGMDWEDGQARRAAEEFGLLDRVRFLGRVPSDEFEALLPVADIGISLRRPPTYGETSGALLQLLRHGVPTIVNDVGTFADYPDDVVRKVRMDPCGVESLVGALRELAEDSDRRRSLGRDARRYVAQTHAWSLAASLYADLIDRLHHDRQARRARRATPQLLEV